MKLEYVITKSTKYISIRQILKEEFLMSDRLIIKLKKAKQIYLNGKSIFIDTSFNIDDIILVNLNFEEENENIVPTKMNLKILYEDDSLLILDKPPFIPVHPSIGHYEDSLCNGIKYYFQETNLKRKIRPVNRLDKNTSGIVLFAKNEYIQECLIKQMKSGLFQKEYLALIDGRLLNKKQVINVPISRKENSIIERCVNKNGNNAITIVDLIKLFDKYSFISCILKTGRTHQIRVHMQYIGHPILGDTLYGNASDLISRQALHAYKVKFIHPINKKEIEIISDLPDDIKRLVNK